MGHLGPGWLPPRPLRPTVLRQSGEADERIGRRTRDPDQRSRGLALVIAALATLGTAAWGTVAGTVAAARKASPTSTSWSWFHSEGHENGSTRPIVNAM
jgi:hypothetical protein